ncbi:FKBP-type peptidyl-prolyl cis-trans isomerase [Acetobacteraceae bacterium ESL0709]|nr:FKBP-type peptidyl-prolyl cis-trans isomerase [Acetobacteraceae bacterium ESL0697]MDF7678545.1 FKBP-type peptidyl-prolyl cis-trans isomerase [Acetobacteraceae bacterium ESL0709]
MRRLKRSARAIIPALALTSLIGLGACGSAPKPAPTGEQFMQQVYKQKDVVKLKDGLAYKVLKSGPKDGPSPHQGSMMMIIYEGRLPDGGIFDSSDMHTGAAYMEMPLDGVIQGWMEGLPLMHVGDVWEFYIPADLAYGKRSMGIIPPNSPLIFKIQLLGLDDGSGL